LFELAYGDDPNGKSRRVDQGETGRWRCFTREEIAKRGNNLDISWLRDESLQSGDGLPEPDAITAQIMLRLQTAMEEMEALTALLGDEEETETALLE
jgi:type I restriction enzyme M protein